MSKPKNCKVYCPALYGRSKMLFQTEEKAKNFIKFNWEQLTDKEENLRVYFCDACGGYHITSKPLQENKKYDRTDKLIEAYHNSAKISDETPSEKKIKRLFAKEVAECYVKQIPEKLQMRCEIKDWVKQNMKEENDLVKYFFFKIIYKKVGISL